MEFFVGLIVLWNFALIVKASYAPFYISPRWDIGLVSSWDICDDVGIIEFALLDEWVPNHYKRVQVVMRIPSEGHVEQFSWKKIVIKNIERSVGYLNPSASLVQNQIPMNPIELVWAIYVSDAF